MPKYLLATTYTAEGLRGLAREGGTARRAEVAGLCESMGGKLEAFYFTTGGEPHLYQIADMPTPEAAWATLLAVGQTGTADVRVVELVLPELIDDAAKMIPPYQAPGT